MKNWIFGLLVFSLCLTGTLGRTLSFNLAAAQDEVTDEESTDDSTVDIEEPVEDYTEEPAEEPYVEDADSQESYGNDDSAEEVPADPELN
jgi:hypothetical protein